MARTRLPRKRATIRIRVTLFYRTIENGVTSLDSVEVCRDVSRMDFITKIYNHDNICTYITLSLIRFAYVGKYITRALDFLILAGDCITTALPEPRVRFGLKTSALVYVRVYGRTHAVAMEFDAITPVRLFYCYNRVTGAPILFLTLSCIRLYDIYLDKVEDYVIMNDAHAVSRVHIIIK